VAEVVQRLPIARQFQAAHIMLSALNVADVTNGFDRRTVLIEGLVGSTATVVTVSFRRQSIVI
jgi:hypothetical protein